MNCAFNFIKQFLACVDNYPDVVAIVCDDREYTYADFFAVVKTMHGHFSMHKQAKKILIALDKNVFAYAAIFAALLSKKQYAPLNMSLDKSAYDVIIQTYAPDIIVCTHADFEQYDAVNINVTTLSSLCGPVETFNVSINDNAAYTLFTSGTTGIPKGVQINLRALNHYVEWVVNTVAVTSGTKWSQHPHLNFDLSVFDIFGALCQGATLVVFNSVVDKFFPAQKIKQYAIEIWNSVPSVIGLIGQGKQLNAAFLGSVKRINFCGEPLFKSVVDSLFINLPEIIIQNTYGPTEATVSCTCVFLNKTNYLQYCADTIAIGQPIKNMQLWVRNEKGLEDDIGELFISGIQLADGYLKDNKLTQEKFVRMYEGKQCITAFKTGDIVQRINQNIYFMHRIGDSIKINGLWVNLQRMREAIQLFASAQVVCFVRHYKIIACIESEQKYDIELLRDYLIQTLDAIHVPHQVISVSKLPLTANGKIDKNELLKEVEGERIPARC